MRRLLSLVLCVGLSLAQTDDFQCPDEYTGYYPHLISCDKYWYCENGVRELKSCGNGLAFIDTDPSFELEQCAELHLVECGERTQIEEPISTENCPRLYGTFADQESCSVFWKCLDGKANRYECPPGLAYDQNERTCLWADQVPECRAVVVAVEGEAEEFQCPSDSSLGVFSKHPHPSDCRQYFVCINGVPREYGCPLGTVFSADGVCADPKEVPECEKYYGDLEFNSNDLSKAGADTGPQPNRGSLSRVQSSRPANRVQQEDVKRRPAPPALQSILEDTRAEEPVKSSFRPSRPRPARPSRPAVEPATEAPKPSRLEVLTDRPRTTLPRRPEIITNRPTTAQAEEERVEPPAPVVIPKTGPGLPKPVPASPGPNGEDYAYYYYYYDEEEAADQQ